MPTVVLRKPALAAKTIVRWIVQAMAVAAVMACAPQAARPIPNFLPPPLGLGEPLSPGPYVFVTDHTEDWPEVIGRLRYLGAALPDLR